MSRIKNFLLEKSEGNGNCAFNAFILGLSRQSVIDRLEAAFIHSGEDPDISLREFIQTTANTLHVPSRWATVKQGLTQLRQQSKVVLQNRMAPVLRKLAMNLAERDAEHQQRTIEPLLSAFDDFVEIKREQEKPVEEKKERRVVEDDIFSRHSFIQERFEYFYKLGEDAVNAAKMVEKWWTSSIASGYRQFLNEMKEDGVWAGDLELFQLARYFHVNLDVIRNDFVHRIYSHSGKIPRDYFTESQIIQLVDRHIINNPNDGDIDLFFLPLTEVEVRERLQAVPEFEKVAWYIQDNEFIKGFSIPAEWSACLKELWIRNLIERKGGEYVFIVERESAMNRSAEMSDYKTILHLWNKFHCDAPTVTLSNPLAVHWSNVLPEEEKPTESFFSDYYKSFLSFVSNSFFSAPAPVKTPARPKAQTPKINHFFTEEKAKIAADAETARPVFDCEL